ncbi:zinc-dependent metalloprotease [Aridibaculum aurantiacum]|uniref:zinc-dependent metalloprotease n=1 Tax=Aridibaculum aurantiacum TaxID=2810307 RepID=UPI001A97B125|nr:zinc-dependent metalloprotease [Aridibaculum aurantiacum]
MYSLLIALLLFPIISFAQKLPSIQDKTKDMTRHEGFLNFYWEEATGKVWLEVNKVDSQVLYVTSLPAGLGSNDVGADRGRLDDEKIVQFKRVGRKLLMVQPNFRYRALSKNPAEQRAVEQSFAQSTIWGFTIEAETAGSVLVDATDFLLRDALKIGNTLRRMRQGNYSFDKTRSSMYLPQSKNFPLNTELEASITLVNNDGETGNFVNAVTPSPDAITLRMHHSFVQLPDNNYTPRAFDPRSSFIATSYYDYSTPVSEPIEKYFIVRHRLQKKDPAAARSEAVKPIIYYLDNGTPEPIRTALLNGAKWWNQAFEAAGFINAFQVQVLPEDADPMDIRYNMINWVHRSTRGWSYGASVVDPRTGEIIKGNVTLGSLRVRQDYLIAQGLLAPFENGVPADDKMLRMALDRLEQLSAHEIGHTLGLQHNYAASVTDRASVMDYPAPYVKLTSSGQIDLSEAYAKGIGDWDKIAINYGYRDFPAGTNEAAMLNKILQDASAKGYQFIADRDARAAAGIHPTAHLWDNAASPVDELKNVLKVRAKALNNFGVNNIRSGTPMAFLEDVLVPIYLYHRYQLEAVTKLVGGLNYTYALRGDNQLVTKPVSKAEQLNALNAVTDALDPKVLLVPQRIIDLIPPRPAGYSFSNELFRKRTGLAFDALAPAETAADLPLSFLLVTERVNRLSQAQSELSAAEVIQHLVNKTWKAPRRSGMEELVQQQTEQVLLTYLLALSQDEKASFATQSVINQALAELNSFIEAKKKTATGNYKGHLALAQQRMKSPEKAKTTQHVVIPPGAPIGCED